MATTSTAFAEAARSVCLALPTTDDPLRVEPQSPEAEDCDLTADERTAINELRSLIAADETNWSEGARREAASHADDFTLMRFNRARPDSNSAALQMYREAMTYRSEHEINKLFRELHPLAPKPWSARQKARHAHYFCGFGGFDRDGAPYFVMRVGQADLGGFSRNPNLLELMMEADACSMEMIFRSVRAGSAATGKFVRARIVVDLTGFSMSTMRHVMIIKQVMKVGPNVFPEGASKVLIVNAPRVFAAAWRIVSPWLPQRSRDKCSLVSCRATPAALDEIIAPEQLPKFLGGTQEESLVALAERVPAEGVMGLDGEVGVVAIS